MAPPPPRATNPDGPIAPPPNLAPAPLATVRGITVNKRIAAQLEAMLAAASADGIVLGGSGYRDPSRQVELRKQHCGIGYYEIYLMPPYLCTPPTAIPGSSLHEQGLAIDFTWKGASLTNRGNAAFDWLSANAARFGFYNLPSEPWHWSISGK
jgi:LAS superfamily LD-carboxypeptidase LdcB